MKKTNEIENKLKNLYLEHSDLDEAIKNLTKEPTFDQLRLQRLKKRKLSLKDQIQKTENSLLPDIIA